LLRVKKRSAALFDAPARARFPNAKTKPRRDWPEKNKAAIEDYNARIECYGAFSDGVRRF
jgi:post-segregation antitoxin (ccd killing protein)